MFYSVDFPRKYWVKFSELEPDWISSELDVKIREILIERVESERI